MIGIIVITHGDFGKCLLQTSQAIVGQQKCIKSITLSATEGLPNLKENISAAFEEVNCGKGVIILTDMFGGTPTNASLSLLKELGKDNIEIITGVNLPILLELFSQRTSLDLVSLSQRICATGKNSIIDAKKLFIKRLCLHKNKH